MLLAYKFMMNKEINYQSISKGKRKQIQKPASEYTWYSFEEKKTGSHAAFL